MQGQIMDERTQAALIGAIAAITTLVVKDVLLPLWTRKKTLSDRRHDQQQAIRDVVWHYAAPLRREVESLYWRLKEIVEERSRYLLTRSPKSSYVNYKRVSTIYRIAAVLGWIRALRRERSYLNPSMSTDGREIENRILALEMAFADGQHIEQVRLNELIRLWCIPAANFPSDQARSALGAELDNCLDDALTRSDKLRVADLGANEQLELCKSASALLSARLSVTISESIVENELKRAIAYFNIRESYLYRDWQAAIGDMMIIPLTGANRRFDVLGFAEFEKRYLSAKSNPKHHDFLWMNRLEGLTVDLDLSHSDPFDARQEQIKEVYEKTKNLADELGKLNGVELQHD
jgi:hypothetical protein